MHIGWFESPRPMLLQKHKPMAVGGIGMVSTANYVARRYGVRSAMPGFIGRRLCPELVFVRPGNAPPRLVTALVLLVSIGGLIVYTCPTCFACARCCALH